MVSRIVQKVWDYKTNSFRELPLDDMDSWTIEVWRLASRYPMTPNEVVRLLRMTPSSK